MNFFFFNNKFREGQKTCWCRTVSSNNKNGGLSCVSIGKDDHITGPFADIPFLEKKNDVSIPMQLLETYGHY